MCGTPNYLAPEVLSKKGHSFEADVWSVGCIMYTLLFGAPPFETCTLEETYSRIRKNKYTLPVEAGVSEKACNLIRQLLQPDPKNRPMPKDILTSDFMTSFRPASMPKLWLHQHGDVFPSSVSSCNNFMIVDSLHAMPVSALETMNKLSKELQRILKMKPSHSHPDALVSQPKLQPKFWITRWVDSALNSGVCYELSNRVVGLLFADLSTLLKYPQFGRWQYFLESGKMYAFTMNEKCPPGISHKLKYLQYMEYFLNMFIGTSKNSKPNNGILESSPYVDVWHYSTMNTKFMRFSNDVIQLNFWDHMKLLVCPHRLSVTIFDPTRAVKTYSLKSIMEYGCSEALEEGLKCVVRHLMFMSLIFCAENKIPST